MEAGYKLKINLDRLLQPACEATSILLFSLWILILSLDARIDLPTFHLDGAFQTASGLYRLDSYQFPGKDFHPYLGIGPLFSLYPAFKIAGGDLAASVFSAQLMTMVFGWISASTIWHLCSRSKRFSSSFVMGAVILFLAAHIPTFLATTNPFTFFFEPGNSLRPIRASIPYLAALIFLITIHGKKSTYLRVILAGSIAGFTLLWSNDFAIPTGLLFGALFTFFLRVEDKTLWISKTFLFIITAIATWVIAITFATAGEPLQFLEYNFIDVAGDQWWYFAPYIEQTRVFSPTQLHRILSNENYFPLVVLAIYIAAAVKTKRIEDVLAIWIGIVLFSGGTLASIGGHIGGYYGGFFAWGLLVIISLPFRLRYHNSFRPETRFHQPALRLQHAMTFGVATMLLLGMSSSWVKFHANKTSARNDEKKFYVPELGGFLPSTWREYIELARENREHRVTEEYWGIWSAINRKFPKWPVDSVIHALGRVRLSAAKNLDDSDVIITSRFSKSAGWQSWSLSHNFWFYDGLINNWQQIALSPATVVWKKVSMTRTHKNVLCEISNDRRRFSIANDSPGFFRVSMRYHFIRSGRQLIMMRNNISYGGDESGYISLDPDSTTATFPILLEAGSSGVYDARTVGGLISNFEIESCKVEQINFANSEILHDYREKQIQADAGDHFYITDRNWIKGISRHFAGFFLPNTPKYAESYYPGSFVLFPNGDIREVISIKRSEDYLNISVTGSILDSEKVGLPSNFKPSTSPAYLD